jgi:electron transport complex protein RnfG
MLSNGLLLGVFAVLSGGLLALTHSATRERILANEREALLRTIHELVPPAWHDNDIFHDTLEVVSPAYLGTSEAVTVYRARREGQPVAAVLTTVAPDGYSGNIKLLVAIRNDGVLAGVRAIRHRETPGLGDAIETARSDWILGFNGKSLTHPTDDHWKVKRDGGDFDQLTGATITSRAVVGAVYRTLHYFSLHRSEIFALPPAQEALADD